MNKNLRNAGLITLGVGALAYPAFLLYKYIAKKRQEMLDAAEGEETEAPVKKFSPAYRGNHKPHHRHAEANGHLKEGVA